MERTSKLYTGVRDVVLVLVKELHHACEAGKHFDTKLARMALDELIELIVKASMEISATYSRSSLGTFVVIRRSSEHV